RQETDIEIVLINDLDAPATLGHLLQYDSVHGTFPQPVSTGDGVLTVGGKEIRVTAIKEPSQLPHAELKVDLVLECTGRFTTKEAASAHLTAGAKRVLISAPAKGQDITLAYGINHDLYDAAKHHIISNASCTTNCLT